MVGVALHRYTVNMKCRGKDLSDFAVSVTMEMLDQSGCNHCCNPLPQEFKCRWPREHSQRARFAQANSAAEPSPSFVEVARSVRVPCSYNERALVRKRLRV